MLERKVYVIQEIPGSQAGTPKINIMGAASYATSNKFNFLLPEFSQMIFSPGPLIYKLRQGLKNYTVYTAAKAGLINFTKSLAKELAPNVLVNSVSPGAILWDVNEPSEDKKNEILASIPMKRIGNEKDIVAIIDYLLSKNTYMTGRNINIDGGKSLG